MRTGARSARRSRSPRRSLRGARALALDVGRVESAPIACDAGQLGDLVCRGEATGRVDQARREAERSLLHRARERRFHGFHLARGRRTIVPPDAPHAERREADPRADIDRRSLPLEPLEVSVQVAPVDRHARRDLRSALGLRRVAHRHNARDLAGDLGGHALRKILEIARPSARRRNSEWPSMSMKPGRRRARSRRSNRAPLRGLCLYLRSGPHGSRRPRETRPHRFRR